MSTFELRQGPSRSHRKVELLKLMSARVDLSGAKEACELLADRKPELGSSLYYSLSVSAIVCYSRPFTMNQPHGALPNRYVRTLTKKGLGIHERVLAARQKHYAHSDLDERVAYIVPPGTIVAKEPHTLRSVGIGSGMNSLFFGLGFFSELRDLAWSLESEVSRDTELLLKELYDGMELPLTRFRLKIDDGL